MKAAIIGLVVEEAIRRGVSRGGKLGVEVGSRCGQWDGFGQLVGVWYGHWTLC